DDLDLRLERRQQPLALRGHDVLLTRWPRERHPARATARPFRAVLTIICGHPRLVKAVAMTHHESGDAFAPGVRKADASPHPKSRRTADDAFHGDSGAAARVGCNPRVGSTGCVGCAGA